MDVEIIYTLVRQEKETFKTPGATLKSVKLMVNRHSERSSELCEK